MNNPKTTMAGYIGLFGTLLIAVAGVLPPGELATLLHTIGLILASGAAALGNVASQDGGH